MFCLFTWIFAWILRRSARVLRHSLPLLWPCPAVLLSLFPFSSFLRGQFRGRVGASAGPVSISGRRRRVSRQRRPAACAALECPCSCYASASGAAAPRNEERRLGAERTRFRSLLHCPSSLCGVQAFDRRTAQAKTRYPVGCGGTVTEDLAHGTGFRFSLASELVWHCTKPCWWHSSTPGSRSSAARCARSLARAFVSQCTVRQPRRTAQDPLLDCNRALHARLRLSTWVPTTVLAAEGVRNEL